MYASLCSVQFVPFLYPVIIPANNDNNNYYSFIKQSNLEGQSHVGLDFFFQMSWELLNLDTV